jgi:hypothetical protein
MRVDESILAVGAARWGSNGRFRKPLYPSWCFARLPATVEYLLTAEPGLRSAALPDALLRQLAPPYHTIILVLIDAFGWEQYERHNAHPFFRRFERDGVVAMLTSQFPSTTAAHMTTLHTGRPVGLSGVPEWYYYEPAADAVIAPLKFAFAGDPQRGTLRAAGISAADFLPSPSLYRQLTARGIDSAVFQHRNYTPSPYSDHVFDGAEVHPYSSLGEGLLHLAELVRKPPPAGRRRYCFLYVDIIDSVGHNRGPESREVAAEVETTGTLLDRLLVGPCAGVGGAGTLLLISADHGQMSVDPTRTVYVNWEVPGIERFFRLTRRGEPIRFGGSCRDLFLYVKPERQAELVGLLRGRLAGLADVCPTAELLAQGFFGEKVDRDRLLPRLGDVAVLPYEGEAVYYYLEGRFAVKDRGVHGGLTPAEMDIGLFALPLG